jgi:hypothetical protein
VPRGVCVWFGPVRRPLPLLIIGLLVAGCGSSSKHETQTTAPAAVLSAQPAPANFPQLKGRTLPQLIKGMPQGPSLGPTSMIFEPGTDRIGFVLIDRARRFINGASVALYTSDANGADAAGPFVVRSESLAVAKPYRSKIVADDPAAPKSIYVAHVPMGQGGRRAILAVARLDGRMVATAPLAVALTKGSGGPPDVGQKAIKVHTPTVASVGGDPKKVDTRVPPAPDLSRVDLAGVLGHKPVALLFATPAYCQSRTCGPVEDILEQASHDPANKRFAFVHVEVYKNNDPSAGFRPQLAAWKLPSEPWLFVIDRHGKVRARFEGAFGAGEVQSALDSVH